MRWTPRRVRSLLDSIVIRLKAAAYDQLRHSATVSELSALSLILRSLLGTARPQRKLPFLTTALRRARRPLVRRAIESLLAPWLASPRSDLWRTAQIGWTRYRAECADPRMLKTLVLKAPSRDGEKGVLYVSFEVNLLRLLEHTDVSRLLGEYFIVGATSSSPIDCPPLFAFANLSPDPLFIQVSHPTDADTLRLCGNTVRVLPLMASDWIDPRWYTPKPHALRDVDILMVAGWARLKGHWMLFRALKRMRKSLTVLLVGQDMEGRTADDVFREAKAFGVSDRIEIIRDAPIRSVSELQCDSKTAVVLSKREGSGVVTAESLFADSPVAMLRGAHVGSLSYINEQTGILTEPGRLHHDLSLLVEQSASYAPRSWALDHITCFRAHRVLNGILRDYALETNQPWTRDIAPFCWRPDPIYLSDDDEIAFNDAYKDLESRYGLSFAGHASRATVTA